MKYSKNSILLITMLSLNFYQLCAKETICFKLDTAITTDIASYKATRDSVLWYNDTDTLIYWLYVDGYLVKWKSFHSKNRIHNDVNFKMGFIEGDLKKYYKNGQVYRETCFKDGKILCGMREYDKKGRLKYLYLTRPNERDKFYGRYKYNKAGEKGKYESVELHPPSYGMFPEYHQRGALPNKPEG